MLDETMLIRVIKERQEVHEKDSEAFGNEGFCFPEILSRIDELEVILKMIDDLPKIEKCGDCSRRKWYQLGYEDGKKQK